MLGILSLWQFVRYFYNRGEEGGLPPLGPPPNPLTNCQVPSPPMTASGKWRRKNESHLPPTQGWLNLLQPTRQRSWPLQFHLRRLRPIQHSMRRRNALQLPQRRPSSHRLALVSAGGGGSCCSPNSSGSQRPDPRAPKCGGPGGSDFGGPGGPYFSGP